LLHNYTAGWASFKLLFELFIHFKLITLMAVSKAKDIKGTQLLVVD